MEKMSLDAILEIAKKIYGLPAHTNLKVLLGSLRGNEKASDALSHAIFVAHQQGYTYQEIIHGMGGTPKGTISRKVTDWQDRINGNPQIFKGFQEKHTLFLKELQSVPIVDDDDIEDAFTGAEEEETPVEVDEELMQDLSQADTTQAEQSNTSYQQVQTPLFEQLAESDVNPLKDTSWAKVLEDLPDDGVPAPKASKTNSPITPLLPPDAGDAPAPVVQNPTNAPVVGNTNTADFILNMFRLGSPLGVHFTQINLDTIEELEDTNKVPAGTVEKVEKHNAKNAQLFQKDLETQLRELRNPLARVFGSGGSTGVSPLTELIVAVIVCVGMLGFTLYAIRSENDRLVRRIKKQYSQSAKNGKEDDFLDFEK